MRKLKNDRKDGKSNSDNRAYYLPTYKRAEKENRDKVSPPTKKPN